MNAKSLYFVLSKKQFGSNKSGTLKEYHVITLIPCSEQKLIASKSYDKFVDKEIYDRVIEGLVYEMEFSIDGKLENINYDAPLGTVVVKLDANVLETIETQRESDYAN